MKILHVIHSMDPTRGGLAAYVAALVPALATLRQQSEIVSLDRSTEPFLRDMPAPTHALGPGRFGYAFSPRLRRWLQAEQGRFDAVIVHGLWQYPGIAVHQAMAARNPSDYFVFAHGMLDPWFKRQYPLKHLKKWCYWLLAERQVLRDAAAVVFTCEEERQLARQSFGAGHYTERVVAFGTAAPPDDAAVQRAAFFQRFPALREKPFWLFLGRIHPKKGIDLLLVAYAALRSRDASLPPLVIAGPCADGRYLHELQTQARRLGCAGSVIWPGMLVGGEKWGALRAAEVFILPSHQENFGIAVVESLGCGTPVLISNQVNIWREIADDQVGLVGPDTVAGVGELLAQWRAMEEGRRQNMRLAAARSFDARYEITAVASSLASLLSEPRPKRS